MTIIAIIVCIIALGAVCYLPTAKNHEACKPQNTILGYEVNNENRQLLTECNEIIQEDVLPYIMEYVRGSANRTVTIRCIMQDIQANYPYMHKVDDRKWDYICEVQPETRTVRAPYVEETV